MATYILTSGNDTLTGTAGADVFDGHPSEGSPGGATGGVDSLDGGSGDDIFLLEGTGLNGFSSGTINGGADTEVARFV